MSVRLQSGEHSLLSDLEGNAELRGGRRKATRTSLLSSDSVVRPVPSELRSLPLSIWTNKRKISNTMLSSFSRIIQCEQVIMKNMIIQCDQVISKNNFTGGRRERFLMAF